MKYHDFSFYWKIKFSSRAGGRYYFYLSRERISVSPWLLTWLANYKRASRSGTRPVFFEISFTKWLRGAKTVQLPVTLLHTQITRLIKHKVVFIRKTPSTCFSLFFPTPFVVHELNKTCHALYTLPRRKWKCSSKYYKTIYQSSLQLL